MLTFFAGRGRGRMCDGLSRRNFLRVGAIGLGGLTLANWLKLDSAQAATRGTRGQKGIISVYLQGGPPHLDMYDMKPEAPAEYRGPFSPIRTNVSGIEISELLPLQAKIADKLAIVRNMQFQQQGHAPPELMTGWADARRPAMGSFISKLQSESGEVGALPPYVSLDRFAYPGFLGAAHNPFVPGDKLDSLTLPASMPLERLDDRKSLLSSFDRLRRDADDQRHTMEGVDAFTQQAMAMVSTSAARDALDVERETQETRDRYGVLVDFLRARRLVEAGVKFVELTVRCDDLKTKRECRSDWDFHDANFVQCDTMLPPYDQAVHALVTDLHERGLEKDICVVIWGEMGRTPRINGNAGRDHWPQAGFTLFAGGGLKTGQVIGATDAKAEEVIGVPYTPQNVLATLYQVLGIDAGRTTVPDLHGRPMYLLEDPKPIRELL